MNSNPTWKDHHDLIFWLRGCVDNGEAFLGASRELRSIPVLRATSPLQERQAYFQRRELCQQQFDRTKYHFVTTMGSLLRHLQRVRSLFPSIQSAYENAKHLQKEGKDLRDMIEHADEYHAGQGRKRKQEPQRR